MTKQITSNAFPEPNHTQTPNLFFDMIPDMEETELRVTLVMIRETFGWHRLAFKLGVDEIRKRTGLSYQGTLNGIKSAVERGTFYRVNPDSKKTAEWSLVVEPLLSGGNDLQPIEDDPPTNRPQVGVKESNKEKRNNTSSLSGKELSPSRPASLAKPKASRPAPIVERPPSQTALLMKAFADYFKLTLSWGHPFQRDFLQWAISDVHMTPAMVRYASNWWAEQTWCKDGPGTSLIKRDWLKSIAGYCEPSQQSQPRAMTREDYVDLGGI